MPGSSNTKKALVIYNPTAGAAVDIDICLGAVVHNLCAEFNGGVTVYPTSQGMGHRDVVDLLSSIGSFDLIVAAGGDGTIRLVLGAVSVTVPQTPVALVPLGTGNQLARNLSIYEENLLADPLIEAINVMLRGQPQPIDLGVMNGEYFCVAAGAGPLSDAVISPSRKEKANFKMLAYVGSMIQTFAAPPVVFRVQTGSDSFRVTASGIFVTNVADLGVGTLSESAELNDGLLDLCIMNPKGFADYVELGFRFAGGFVGGEAPYYIRKVDSVRLEVVPVRSRLSSLQSLAHRVRSLFSGKSQDEQPPAYEEVTAMIDGDACGTTPMEISVAPNAVTVLTPPQRADHPGAQTA